ncbi:MAG TPA: hypothetical protein DIV86_07715 [Alphaproteobacteria bacterium]|nr:hypothetical protein [Alphaproteobacteria bacterium]
MLQNNKLAGFSLVEAMVASLLIGISFIGVYGYASYSTTFLTNSSERQDLQIIADQIFEVLDTDRANLSSYATNFNSCSSPTEGQTEKYHTYKYKWCQIMQNKFGTPSGSDVRSITVSNVAGGKLVTVTLQAKNKRSQIVAKKFYDE